MNQDRRKFIKQAGAVAAGSLLLSAWACNQAAKAPAAADAATPPAPMPSIPNFGIQLWTVKEDMATDAKGTLKQLSSFGYKQIESFQGDKGIFWGMKPTEFKQYMTDLGMTLVSSHCDINKDFSKTVAEAVEAGVSYLICPYFGPQPKLDDFKKFADTLNKRGEECKKAGIRFAYHNHDYSFKPLEGQLPQDVMMQIADPNLVDFQLDIYWIAKAGVDPVAYMQKYPNRFRLCHVKDMAAAEPMDSCILGTGTIMFPKVLKVAAEQGMQYYIVEQEAFAGSTPLKSAEADAKYLQAFEFAKG